MGTGKTFVNRIREFMKERDLIYLMIAVYIGTILNKFLTTFTNSVIIPVIDLITPDAIFAENAVSKNLEKLGFVNLRELVRDFLSLGIAIIMSYYLIRFVLNVK